MRSAANGLGWEPAGGRVRRIPLGRDPADRDDRPGEQKERTWAPHEHERVGLPATPLALCQRDTKVIDKYQVSLTPASRTAQLNGQTLSEGSYLFEVNRLSSQKMSVVGLAPFSRHVTLRDLWEDCIIGQLFVISTRSIVVRLGLSELIEIVQAVDIETIAFMQWDITWLVH